MIVKSVTTRRSGANMFAYLMDQEKDRNSDVRTLFVSGAVASDMDEALNEFLMDREFEAQFVRGQKTLLNIVLNPQDGHELTDEQFMEAGLRAMQHNGLEGQPFALVLHEQEDKGWHGHLIASRIDRETWTLFDTDGHNRHKDIRLARQLEKEWGHEILSEYGTSTFMTDAFHDADDADEFAKTLKDAGFELARGNRGVVMSVDRRGRAASLRNQIKSLDWEGSIPTAEFLEFLGDDYAPEKLAHVDRVKQTQLKEALKSKHFETLEERLNRIEKRADAQLLVLNKDREFDAVTKSRDLTRALNELKEYDHLHRPELVQAQAYYEHAKADYEPFEYQQQSYRIHLERRDELFQTIFKNGDRARAKFKDFSTREGIDKALSRLDERPSVYGRIEDGEQVKLLKIVAGKTDELEQDFDDLREAREEAQDELDRTREAFDEELEKPDQERALLQQRVLDVYQNLTARQFNHVADIDLEHISQIREELDQSKATKPEAFQDFDHAYIEFLRDRANAVIEKKQERILEERDKHLAQAHNHFEKQEAKEAREDKEKSRFVSRSDKERKTVITEEFIKSEGDFERFANALDEELGLVLARGHLKSGKPTFMVVDIDGEPSELYRQIKPIDGKKIKKRELEEPLKEARPFEELPSIEEAQAIQQERGEQEQEGDQVRGAESGDTRALEAPKAEPISAFETDDPLQSAEISKALKIDPRILADHLARPDADSGASRIAIVKQLALTRMDEEREALEELHNLPIQKMRGFLKEFYKLEDHAREIVQLEKKPNLTKSDKEDIALLQDAIEQGEELMDVKLGSMEARKSSELKILEARHEVEREELEELLSNIPEELLTQEDNPELKMRLARKDREFDRRIEYISSKAEMRLLASDLDDAFDELSDYIVRERPELGQAMFIDHRDRTKQSRFALDRELAKPDYELRMREFHIWTVAQRVSDGDYANLSKEQRIGVFEIQKRLKDHGGIKYFHTDAKEIEDMKRKHSLWVVELAEQRVERKRAALQEERREALDQIRKNYNMEIAQRAVDRDPDLGTDDPELDDDGPELSF